MPGPSQQNATCLERHNPNHENLFFRDPEIIDFVSLGGPGDPRNHSKRRGANSLRLLEIFLRPPGPSRPPPTMMRGPRPGPSSQGDASARGCPLRALAVCSRMPGPSQKNAICLERHNPNHENLFFRDPEIIDFGSLGGPGGPRNHSKRRGAKRPAFWRYF